MFLRKFGVGAAASALMALSVLPAVAVPTDYQIGFQSAASPVMEQIEDFHRLLLWIIVAVCLFVLALLVWIVVKYRAGANPVPSKVHHNTLLEVAWTLIPVIILVFIAVPSFRLLYFEAAIPKPDVTIKAIGKQWFWTYQYPDNGNFQFDALLVPDRRSAPVMPNGSPRLLGTTNHVVVPVGKTVRLITTGADVIHSWAIPAFGVKMDAVPGRINQTWFKAEKEGTYYGECSELCGARHAFMPITVDVVSQAQFDMWVQEAKTKFAAVDAPTRVAADH